MEENSQLIQETAVSENEAVETVSADAAPAAAPSSTDAAPVRKLKHIRAFDHLRILAAFFVIFNHSVGQYYDKLDMHKASGVIGIMLFTLCKTAVPLFLMISGALLLDKAKVWDYKKTLKYVIRALTWLVVWSLIYAVYQKQLTHIKDLPGVLRGMFMEKPVKTPLWYVYTLLGIYLTLPFISRMTAMFRNRDYIALLSLWFVFNSVLPTLNKVLTKQITTVSYFQKNLFTGWVGFLILGQFLWKNRERLCRFRYLFLAFVLTVCGFIGSVSVVRKTENMRSIDNAGFLMPTAIAVFIFLLFLTYATVQNELNMKQRVVKAVADTTLGVYLLHPLLRDIFLTKAPFAEFYAPFNKTLFGVLTLCVILFIRSALVTFILSKIPLVRRIVQ